MKKTLSNKTGFSYILTCVIILITVMIVFISLQYAFVYHIAAEQKRETQLKLDGYITQCAVKNFDALKQGAAWDEFIDSMEMVDGAYDLLGFPDLRSEAIVAEGKYEMSRPDIYVLSGDCFGVRVRYEITVPFEAFGRKVADIVVPIEIQSRYTEK